MGVPCSGELQFWAVVQAQLRNIATQLTRIADALELMNSSKEPPTGALSKEAR